MLLLGRREGHDFRSRLLHLQEMILLLLEVLLFHVLRVREVGGGGLGRAGSGRRGQVRLHQLLTLDALVNELGVHLAA